MICSSGIKKLSLDPQMSGPNAKEEAKMCHRHYLLNSLDLLLGM